MTEPNENITKLSDAIEHGAKIAEENGIKRGEGILFRRNVYGEICRACALGMAYLGVFGVEQAKSDPKSYDTLAEKLRTQDNNECATKAFGKASANMWTIESLIVDANDDGENLETIVEKLRKCDL